MFHHLGKLERKPSIAGGSMLPMTLTMMLTIALATGLMLMLSGCTVKPMKAISRMSQVEIQPDLVRVRYQNQVTPLGDRFAPKGAPQGQGAPEIASKVTTSLLYSSYVGGDNADYGKD